MLQRSDSEIYREMPSNQDRYGKSISAIQGDTMKYLRITHAHRNKNTDKHIYMPTHTHTHSHVFKENREFPICK